MSPLLTRLVATSAKVAPATSKLRTALSDSVMMPPPPPPPPKSLAKSHSDSASVGNPRTGGNTFGSANPSPRGVSVIDEQLENDSLSLQANPGYTRAAFGFARPQATFGQPWLASPEPPFNNGQSSPWGSYVAAGEPRTQVRYGTSETPALDLRSHSTQTTRDVPMPSIERPPTGRRAQSASANVSSIEAPPSSPIGGRHMSHGTGERQNTRAGGKLIGERIGGEPKTGKHNKHTSSEQTSSQTSGGGERRTSEDSGTPTGELTARRLPVTVRVGGAWKDCEELPQDLSDSLLAAIHHHLDDPKNARRWNMYQANLGDKMCMLQDAISGGKNACAWKPEAYTACKTCTNKKRPCVKLLEDGDGGAMRTGVLPLETAASAKADWRQLSTYIAS